MIRSCFFFQAEDGIRDAQESRGLGDVYKRQIAATAFVYAQQGIYDLGYDHYAGGLASAALVIGDHRRRYAQMVGQVGLGNGEVATPLSQGITRIGRKGDLSSNLLGQQPSGIGDLPAGTHKTTTGQTRI